MRYTLIEMVQRILESMDSDEVSDIAQTTESLAVANIVKECYYEIIGQQDLPEKMGLFNLDASGDSAKPCLMTLPSTALNIKSLKYNQDTTISPSWYDVRYLQFDDFLSTVNTLDTDLGTVGTQLVEGFLFKFKNDRHPTWYTSTDDYHVIFDSYDASVDSTLQSVKTMCYGSILPTFNMSNSYVPDIDARQFQLLLQSAKAQAFVELKQIENPKAEKKERRNIILAQRTKDAVDKRTALQRLPQYGRK